MTSINIDDFPIEIDSVFYRLLSTTIDSYRLLSILLLRFPTSIDINRPIKWININDID